MLLNSLIKSLKNVDISSFTDIQCLIGWWELLPMATYHPLWRSLSFCEKERPVASRSSASGLFVPSSNACMNSVEATSQVQVRVSPKHNGQSRAGIFSERCGESWLISSPILPAPGRASGKTRGQGPYRPAATRAMNDGQIVLKRSIEIRNKLYVFIYKYHIAYNSLFENI